MGWFFKIATSDIKIFVNSLTSHEIRAEILEDYTGESEMIGDNVLGEQTTAMRFKNIEHYESYFGSIDMHYDADDNTFTGCFF